MERPSVFAFAGGEPAFRALAAAHHQRCLADPVLHHAFSHGVDSQHVQRLAWYWGEVFGGPPRYTQECGGHSAMLAVHAGVEAEPALWDRFVQCFVAALDDAGLPADAELRSTLREYMEWAVQEVRSYGPRGSQVAPDQPVPRWSWHGHQDGPTT